MSLQVYPPINIINIIINEFFPYRNIKLVNNRSFDDDTIIKDMEFYGYIRIDGISANNRGNRDRIIIIITKNNDINTNNTELKRIKKIIEQIDEDIITKENKLDELFLIINKELIGKKNFTDIIKDLHDRQKKGLDIEGEKPYYSVFPYHNFSFSVPKCKILFPHILMTKEEVNELLQNDRLYMSNLPIILTNDVNIIWNGGRPGQVVRIHRYSETSLESVYYRRIESHIK